MKVWVFTGQTESGDDVGPYVFLREPTTVEMQDILRRDWPSEFDMDEDDWIDADYGYISQSSLEETEVIDL